MLLLIGGNAALLEGLAQSMARSGLRVAVAASAEEATDLVRTDRPVMIVAERGILEGGVSLQVAAAAAGCAIVVFREEASRGGPAMQSHVARLIIADLELPLERHRLEALAQYVADRARAAGRVRTDQPPDALPP